MLCDHVFGICEKKLTKKTTTTTTKNKNNSNVSNRHYKHKYKQTYILNGKFTINKMLLKCFIFLVMCFILLGFKDQVE